MTEITFAAGTECNKGRVGKMTELFGDPAVKPEKPHTIVRFPGGDVEIARCEDGSYWVHIAVHSDIPHEKPGQIIGARVDAKGRYCDDANAVLEREIAKGDVQHIAFLVSRS